MIVLDEGPLVPALMATCAFPLLFSPVRYGGRWLVDGGAVNNLPVDIVRALGVDRVIGVSTPQRIVLNAKKEDKTRGLSIRALSLFGAQTRNWRTPFLIAEASMGFAIQLVNQQRCNLCRPDVLIQVPLHNVGLFDHEGRAARDTRDAILADVDRFAGDALQGDDIALMLVVRETPSESEEA